MASGPLPLVIGITGHRDVREGDVPALEAALRGVFGELLAQYPHTSLIALSSLAEGADRIGARVALDAGAQLVVPLPMDVASYEHDFRSDASRAEFHELLGRARRVIVVPELLHARHNAATPPTRDEHYVQAGAYLATTCQILIAMWDGNEVELPGGTAHVVRFKLKGVDPRYIPTASPLDPPDTGPVIRIITPRLSSPQPNVTFDVETMYPSAPGETLDGERSYERRVFKRIETFNNDAVNLQSTVARDEQRSSAQLTSFAPTSIEQGASSIRRVFAQSDALALHFQKRTREALLTLFIWIFLAATLFEAAKGLGEGLHVLIGVYATIVAGATAWYYLSSRGDYRTKFLDYRALAEGLRVQFFWWIGGIREDVASHYLRKQRGELDWIRVAAANANLAAALEEPAESAHVAHEPSAHALRAVLNDWIQSQHDYYTRAAWRDQRLSDRIDRIAGWFLWAAIVLSLVRALTLILHFGSFETAENWLSADPARARLFDLLFTIFFVAAALLHNYAEKRALSQQSKQYERMSIMFGACAERLRPLIDAGHFGQARELIRELGREALNENADWVLLHRERPLELSVKG